MIALIISLLFTNLQNLHFNHKGLESGLVQMPINGLYQDENGTLWVGTREGVNYYDGSVFCPLSNSGQSGWIMSNRVPTICGDGNGSIFINANYTVIRYDLKQDYFTDLFTQDNTASPPEISIHYGSSGLWIGCSNRLLLWKRDAGLKEVLSLPGGGLSISSLLEEGDTLYIGTKMHGLLCLDIPSGQYRRRIDCNEVICLFSDSGKRIWCGTLAQGAFCLEGETLRHYTKEARPELGSNYIRAISEDLEGRIWMGTSQGLAIIDTIHGVIIHKGAAVKGESGLSNISIWSLLRDKSGTMWIGSYFGGLDYCNFENSGFNFDDFGFQGNSGRSLVSSAVCDNSNRVWIGSEGKGLIEYKDGRAVSKDKLPFSAFNIKSLTYDPGSSLLWVCTHMGGLWSYNVNNGHYRHFDINAYDQTARSESILNVTLFRGNVYIGTLQGVFLLNPNTGTTAPVPEINRHIYEADKLLVSNDSTSMWIVGNSICRYDFSNGVVEDYTDALKDLAGGIPITSVSILETKDGSIYVGTAGLGLLQYDRSLNSFSKVTTVNSTFPSKYIGALHVTSDGRLLAATGEGLCWYDPKTRFVDSFRTENNFPLVPMFPGCIAEYGDNLILGGSNGIVTTTEAQLKNLYRHCTLSISQMFVNDTQVRPDDKSGILKQAIRYTRKVSLPFSKNDLTFFVGCDIPSHSSQVRYLFTLDGLENDWHTQALTSPIHYSNLSPGRYVLRLRNIRPADGEQYALQIRIRPPIYSSWYAVLLYLLLILSVAAFVLYYFATKFKLTTSLALERKNQAEAEKINQQKIRFFANMSHELRTPLTLMIGKLEMFGAKNSLTPEQRDELDGIHSSASELISLVNNQMDVLKMGEDALFMNSTSGDIIEFIRSIVSDFQVLALKNQVSLKFSTSIRECIMEFDESQMKKVFSNLISNAIKYTPKEKGKIRVSVAEPSGGTIRISVKDNGLGIEDSAKERIFDRFFQSNNAVNRDPSVTGTGIGLYLVSYIVHMHQGTVELDSHLGKGSTFTVCLPLSQIAPSVPNQQYGINPGKEVRIQNEASSESSTEALRGKSVLIVEDDDKLRQMLKDIFSNLFTVYEAENGQKALEITDNKCPDLIISDIMMPIMSGDEFCRRVKTNFNTCHIPIILLTALADVENNIMGFDCGADDYITKPFNTQLLLARCISIINNRALLQKRYSKDMSAGAQVLSKNKADIDFMEKLVKLVEENLLERDITVPFLCEQMAMGHTKLFNKIKGLTGDSPQALIQNVRIKYAAKLLHERDDLNVSDIAFQLGFSSLNYFEKCFKKNFGQTPSSFRKGTSITQNNEKYQ